MAKHKKACSNNQHVFIPFAFDTFGFLTPYAVNLLKIVQKVIHSNVDLTGIYPLVGLGNFIVGRAAHKAASSKMAKHKKACSNNQHVFIPFAFDTFGFLTPYVVNLLKIVQRVMHSNVVSPKCMNVIFQRLGFAIQKGLAEQLVVRLPFINM
ncbi:hypothetical protein QL285_035827 [Trifolium repens]|nr:hypothetical protein QL285_035827 [Trifolium repens]